MVRFLFFFFNCLMILLFPLLILIDMARTLLSSRPSIIVSRLLQESRDLRLLLVADHSLITFEVSSQGELEQIRPLIFSILEKEKTKTEQKVLIMHSSNSVRKDLLALQSQYPQRVLIQLYPLAHELLGPLGFIMAMAVTKTWRGPFSLLKKSTFLGMARYDFFPALLSYPRHRSKFLFSATLKSLAPGPERQLSFLKKLYAKNLYKNFDAIFPATNYDYEAFLKLLPPCKNNKTNKTKIYPTTELRVPQIMKRLEKAHTTLQNFSELNSYAQWLKDKNHFKIVWGNAWMPEIESLNHPEFLKKLLSGEVHLFIAPHSLKKDFLEMMIGRIEHLTENKISLHHFTPLTAFTQKKNLFQGPFIGISSIPGVLCEMYSLFDTAYVGGGFGRSVHSILEPYLAGNTIICGPKVQRSTEWEVAKEASMNEVFTIQSPNDYFSALPFAKGDPRTRENMALQMQQRATDIMQTIG